MEKHCGWQVNMHTISLPKPTFCSSVKLEPSEAENFCSCFDNLKKDVFIFQMWLFVILKLIILSHQLMIHT